MSASHKDIDYTDDMDSLVGAVESMNDPRVIENWNAGLFNSVVGPDLLPSHIPCLGQLRLLKTCIRSSWGGVKSCVPQVKDVEKCSAEFFYEMNRKLPKGVCEKEKQDYFTMMISDLATLKEAKKQWIKLFECAKTVEHTIVLQSTPRRPPL